MLISFDFDVESTRSMSGSGDDGDHAFVAPTSFSAYQSIYSSRNFSFPCLFCLLESLLASFSFEILLSKVFIFDLFRSSSWAV